MRTERDRQTDRKKRDRERERERQTETGDRLRQKGQREGPAKRDVACR